MAAARFWVTTVRRRGARRASSSARAKQVAPKSRKTAWSFLTSRAAAWAIDGRGNNPYAVVPGGTRQRTLAYRFGTNLVMYALTGNYKGDQVHVPAILERLGN